MTDSPSDAVPVWPMGMDSGANPLRIAPGILSGDFLFVTGMTGSCADGSMPADPQAQFHGAFDKLGAVLAAAGLDFTDLVEMTSYHVDIRTHFDQFAQVRAEYLSAPATAWTAVGVAELRRVGALVEVKIIARRRT